MASKIALGADHGGYEVKEEIKKVLLKKRYSVKDVGTQSADPCDYPAFGFDAAQLVSKGKVKKAVIICKTGIGMAVIANKLPGVRAGVCMSKKDAVSARQHNDTNVLVLAASKTGKKKACQIVEAWMKTRALRGRHARRVNQIKAFEKKVFK
jgi:RpiB/LacA/LacB family sugar-phosphate isomerase